MIIEPIKNKQSDIKRKRKKEESEAVSASEFSAGQHELRGSHEKRGGEGGTSYAPASSESAAGHKRYGK